MTVNKKIKIGIYSGEIPSSIFIENLIIGLSKYFSVHVYGTLNKRIAYDSHDVTAYPIHKSKLKRIVVFFYRLIIFFLSDFKTFLNLSKRSGIFSFSKMSIKNLEKIIPLILYKPDIIHFQWPTTLRYFELILDDITTIVSLRGSLVNIKPFLYPEIKQEYLKNFNKVDAFHAVSDNIAKVSNQFISNEKRITVIKPAVHEDILSFKKNKWNYNKTKKLKIISVGGNKWVKGFTYAIDAMKILKDMDINFQYTLIASGEDNQKLKYQIDNLELGNHINYIPGLNHKGVIREISESHIYLLSSVSEGIANVVIESMAIGSLVLSTNCGGMQEVIIDGENGFLVPIRSPKLIAEKIIMITNYKSKDIMKIIRNANDTIKSNHLLNDHIDEMKKLYLETLRF